LSGPFPDEILYRISSFSAGSQPSTSNHTINRSTKTNMTTTISFHPDGTARCLWTEAVPLHELGRLEITRASNIEFNNGAQQWEVKDRKGRVRFFAKSRSACFEWEQGNLQPE
jgi:hypothetical protein